MSVPNRRREYWKETGLRVGVAALLFAVAPLLSLRIDLTEDQRFTLSEASLQSVEGLKGSRIEVDVLLGEGLPEDFALLKQEVRLLLEQYSARHGDLRVAMFDPVQDLLKTYRGDKNPEGREFGTGDALNILTSQGIVPFTVTEGSAVDVSQKNVFPYAVVSWGGNFVRVPLLKKTLGVSLGERINLSVQELEYAFADAFRKIGFEGRKRLGIVDGQGELDDAYMADFMGAASEYYDLVRVSLDSSGLRPAALLDSLRTLDALLIAKPTEAFTEEKVYLLDQYLAGGGRGLWLLDSHRIAQPGEGDPLSEGINQLAVARKTGLEPLLFHLGLRFRGGLVNDMYSTPIVVASGQGRDAQYNPLLWVYYPMVFPDKFHPISANIQPLQLKYADGWDTLLRAGLRKKVLLQSSPASRIEGFPRPLDLQLAGQPPQPDIYQGKGSIPLGMLIEGRYRSFFENKVRPLSLPNHRVGDLEIKLLLISDGDVVVNQFQDGKPLELGYDKWTNSFYGNKEFLINALHYLMGQESLLLSRSRAVDIPRLDPVKVKESLGYWQVYNLALPLVLIALAAIGTLGYRQRKYGR